MASSELSLILNNANANLYPSEPQPNLLSMTAPMGRPPHLSEMTFGSNTNSTMAGSWDLVNPQMWTRQNVLEWIGFHVEESRFDARLLNMNYCDMDGITLCTMSKETLMNMFGPVLGEQLHHSLETLKARYATDLSETCLSESELDLLDNILQNSFPFMHGPSLGPLLETVVVQPSIPSDNSEKSYSYFDEYTNQLTPESDHGYDSLTESFQSSHTGSFLNPSSPESNSSDSDPEYSEMHYSASTKNFVKQESVETKKRGRGRPPKPRDSEGYEHFIQSKKSKHAPRGTHLWEFIRDILVHPEQNQGLMKWEDRRDGVFKFLKSEAVAQLWGQKKKNSSMTYEKLSRAMRYYYKREILERVDGRRLVYKFGKNSTGWRIEETGY
uniref:E74-like factor 3 (ets domain transcription factor, epithelial-specific ) n=1 Tax=Cyprinus carpio TaxID=7962 RepID=A0A8C1VZF6_CYPCA